jgi:hypothetical protein
LTPNSVQELQVVIPKSTGSWDEKPMLIVVPLNKVTAPADLLTRVEEAL